MLDGDIGRCYRQSDQRLFVLVCTHDPAWIFRLCLLRNGSLYAPILGEIGITSVCMKICQFVSRNRNDSSRMTIETIFDWLALFSAIAMFHYCIFRPPVASHQLHSHGAAHVIS